MKKHPMPLDVVLDVHEREKGLCAVCGLPVGREAGHLHHRQPRGMGGGSGKAHALSNIVLLHATCHLTHVELKRANAYQNGWLVQHWKTPSETPFRYMLNRTVLLNDDGTITEIGERT